MQTFEAIDLFISSRISKRLRPRAIKWYSDILRAYASRYSELPEIPEPIETFLANPQVGDERAHGYYRALKAFYRFLARRRHVKNPILLVDPPIRSKKYPAFRTPEELEKLKTFPQPPVIHAALLFLIDSGARVSEAHALSLDDLKDTPWGYVATVRGKTGMRVVPISYETYHALMVNLPFPWSSDWFARRIKKAFIDAGIPGSAHVLRHTFGTLWEGEELVLQSILGHASLSTTRIYRHTRVKHLLLQHRLYSPLRLISGQGPPML